MRRAARALSIVLIAVGVLMLADAGLTVVWQEPLSALYAQIKQDQLADKLRDLERQQLKPGDRLALKSLRAEKRRMAFLARKLRRDAGDGQPIGRIHIPRLGITFVVVEGTNAADLRSGPGRYIDTSMPGLSGTTAVAGHRTTYLAPFRNIDKLGRGSEVDLEMPYGRFVYQVFQTRIVKPSQVAVLRSVPKERRLVLTACNPLYSAKQRIVVFARLVASEARGSALVS